MTIKRTVTCLDTAPDQREAFDRMHRVMLANINGRLCLDSGKKAVPANPSGRETGCLNPKSTQRAGTGQRRQKGGMNGLPL